MTDAPSAEVERLQQRAADMLKVATDTSIDLAAGRFKDARKTLEAMCDDYLLFAADIQAVCQALTAEREQVKALEAENRALKFQKALTIVEDLT